MQKPHTQSTTNKQVSNRNQRYSMHSFLDLYCHGGVQQLPTILARAVLDRPPIRKTPKFVKLSWQETPNSVSKGLRSGGVEADCLEI